MLVGIHQPHYLPWLRYFEKIARSDVFVLLEDVAFTKNGWQNRNRIKTAQGAQLLTLPVRVSLGQPIHTVELVRSEEALAKHARAIEMNYRKAPYFARYWPELEPFFHRSWERLAEIDREMLVTLLRLLGIDTPVRSSLEFRTEGTGTERLVELVRAVGGTAYLTGGYALQTYLDPETMRRAGIELVVQEWTPPVYRQQYPAVGFIPDLCVLDLLFNEGERSLEILLSAGAAARVGVA